ncbi:hypothetical protein SGCOL_000151 [Colletotrichum sp. CLE4]
MRFETVSGAVALLAMSHSAAADPVNIKLHSRRANLSKAKTLSKRASAGSVSLTNWFENFDLQWIGEVDVGTPPQKHIVTFDTGSTDLILPSTACTNCLVAKEFNASSSTTFSPTPGNNVTTAFGTGGKSVPYAVPQAASGTVVTDTVTIANLTVANQTWLLCDTYAEAFNEMPNIDGIFGLGPPGFSHFSAETNTSFSTWFWTLAQNGGVPEPLFSFFLNSGEGSAPGELTLGGVNKDRYDGEIANVDFNMTVSYLGGSWFIDQPAFYINGKTVVNSNASDAAFPVGVSNVDTGTAFLQTPDYQTAKDIYAAISSEITQIDELGVWGAPCDVVEKLDPELTFTLGVGDNLVNMTVPKGAFNLGEYPGHSGVCQTIFLNPVQPISELASIWVLGSPLLKGYYTVWNGTNPEQLTFGVASLKANATATNGTSSPTATPTAVNGGSVTGPAGVLAAVALTMFALSF